MAYSCIQFDEIKKKPPLLAVFWNFGWVSRLICCYVNRPHLHRLWAGVAKIKIKGMAGNGSKHG
jgi:hypothetical protein